MQEDSEWDGQLHAGTRQWDKDRRRPNLVYLYILYTLIGEDHRHILRIRIRIFISSHNASTVLSMLCFTSKFIDE